MEEPQFSKPQLDQQPQTERHYVVSSITSPPRGPFGLILKIVIGVVVLAAAGTGIVLATRVWDPLWSPFRPEPEKVLKEMIKNMGEQKKFHSGVKMDFKINDPSGNGKLSLAFDGDSDFSDPQNKKSSFSYSLDLTAAGQGSLSFALEEKIMGEDTYLKIADFNLPAEIEPFLAMYNIDLNSLKGVWISIDKKSFEEMGLPTGQSFNSEAQQKLMGKIQKLFSESKIYAVKKELADEKSAIIWGGLDNQKMYHYTIVLDNLKTANLAGEIIKVVMEEVMSQEEFQNAAGGSFPPVGLVVPAIKEQISVFLEKAGELTADLWIGKKDGLLYKIEAEKGLNLSDIMGGNAPAEVNIKLEVNSSKFGQSLIITPPTDAQKLEDIFAPVIEQINTQNKINSIKDDMLQLKFTATSIFTIGKNYSKVNCQNEEIKPFCDSIKSNAGSELTIYSSSKKYCAYVKLPSTVGQTEDNIYCVSDGSSAETPLSTALKYCNKKTIACPPAVFLPF